MTIKQMSYREALAQAAHDEMELNSNVIVFGLDVPDHKRIYGSTVNLVEKFGPSRCFGTPLSEDAMTGAALGLALSGYRPIHVHIRSDFMLLGMNQIANMISNTHYLSAGRLKAPLVIRAVIGRGWGQGAQHSKSLHNFFAHIPGLKVIMPTTPQDGYSMLRAAIQDDNPVICLEHRWLYDISGTVDCNLKETLGKASVRQTGTDISIITTSWMTVEAMKASEVLKKLHGISVEVIDVRSIFPLDEKTIIESVTKTKNAVVCDYGWVYCGFGAELSATIHEKCFTTLKKPVSRLGFEPVPCPTTRPLESLFYNGAASIIQMVENKLELKPCELPLNEFYTYENRFKGPF